MAYLPARSLFRQIVALNQVFQVLSIFQGCLYAVTLTFQAFFTIRLEMLLLIFSLRPGLYKGKVRSSNGGRDYAPSYYGIRYKRQYNGRLCFSRDFCRCGSSYPRRGTSGRTHRRKGLGPILFWTRRSCLGGFSSDYIRLTSHCRPSVYKASGTAYYQTKHLSGARNRFSCISERYYSQSKTDHTSVYIL